MLRSNYRMSETIEKAGDVEIDKILFLWDLHCKLVARQMIIKELTNTGIKIKQDNVKELWFEKIHTHLCLLKYYLQ